MIGGWPGLVGRESEGRQQEHMTAPRDVLEDVAPTEQFYDYAEVAAIAQARGLKHITENSVITASYKGNRPLKKVKFNGRVYYSRSAVEAWLTGLSG
jgi:hypothetical protein